MARPRIGDVYELETPKGFAYFQYTHETKSDGSLVRVLPGTYQKQPPLDTVVGAPQRYFAFVPVAAAVRKGLIRAVGNVPVPESARGFPLFKCLSYAGPQRPWRWDLWDGERLFKVDSLSPEQAALPIREVVTPSLLADRIAADWSPADDANSPPFASESATGPVSHYAYFDKLVSANSAASQLRSSGLDVDVSPGPDGATFALTAVAAADDERTEQAAVRFGGVYDGYQRRQRARGAWPTLKTR